MTSLKVSMLVTPAEAGVHPALARLDSGSRLKTCRDKLRRNDAKKHSLTFCKAITLCN